MTTTFEAKVCNMDCQIHLDDEYHIEKITTNNGRWIVTLPDEEVTTLEQQYDYIIDEIKRGDEQDAREYDEHIRRETSYLRQL